MSNPASPVTYANRLKAVDGLAQIQIDSPLAFTNPADAIAFTGPLSAALAQFASFAAANPDFSGPRVQRQYLNSGDTLPIGDEQALIVAGAFRCDGDITFSGSGFIHFV